MTFQRTGKSRGVVAVVVLLLAGYLAPVEASVCTLADRIQAANTDKAVGFCPGGDEPRRHHHHRRHSAERAAARHHKRHHN